MNLPACIHCVHYFVTYEPSQPYGCRAMGFKSRQNPALVVYRSSGVHCRLFEKKKLGPKGGPGKSGGGIIA